MDGLTEKDRSGIQAALRANPRVSRAILFGSRALGSFRGASDVDLALEGHNLGLRDLMAIQAEIGKLGLPIEVDLVVRARIRSPELERHIQRHGREWYRRPEAIKGGWEQSTLGECADWASGGTPSKGKAEFWSGSIPWVSAKDMKAFRIYDTEDHITEAAIGKGGKTVPAGTVLMLVHGMTLHKDVPICVATREVAFNQDVKALRPKPGVDGLYLAYWLLAHKPDLLASVDEAGHRTGRLVTENVKRKKVWLPALSEQRDIASILGALDDKIELNRRMNATLEAMARALFRSWFVDFDPVRAKAAGQKPAGMDAATAALFPRELQDSEIGAVPKGWEVEPFVKHFYAERGLSYKGNGLRDDGSGLPMHNLNSVHEGGGYKHEGIKYYSGVYRAKHLLTPGDMIVTNTEQGFDHLLIGHAAIVPECFGPRGLFSHHIYRVQMKRSSPLTPHFLVPLFNHPRWHSWISGFSNGTTINMLPIEALQMPLLVVPPAELVNRFAAVASSSFAKIEANLELCRKLAALRDALLPKLLSGELTPASVEKDGAYG